MRTYDIPYVQNPKPIKTAPPKLEDLDLKDILKNHLCWKSQGRISECMKCPTPCAYGKRALELAFPSSEQAELHPKLINNRTLLELAREDAAKQREEAVKHNGITKEKEENVEPKETEGSEKKKRKRIFIDNWYDKAYESENPLQWIMENFNMTERKAKKKVYAYQHAHPELKSKPMWKTKEKSEKKDEPVKETAAQETVVKEEPVVKEEVCKQIVADKTDESLLLPLENKINALMNKQEEYKQKIEELTKEYEEKIAPYRKLYQETKAKVDALYEALNILNE